MAHAEKLAQQLIKYWLIWLQAQCCELPVRFGCRNDPKSGLASPTQTANLSGLVIGGIEADTFGQPFVNVKHLIPEVAKRKTDEKFGFRTQWKSRFLQAIRCVACP